MDRRSFLRSSGAIAGATALPLAADTAVAAPAVVKQRHRLSVATRFPVAQPGTSTFQTRLAESVLAMSDGRIELMPPIRAAKDTSADLILEFPQSDGEMAFAHDIIAGYPGGLSPAMFATWLDFGGGARLWGDIAEAAGRKAFYAGTTNSGPMLWSRLEHLDTEHLTGISVDTTGFGQRVVRALGGTLQAAPEAELADGFSPYVDFINGVPARYNWMFDSPFHPEGRVLSLTMPRGVWDSLSASDQALLEGAIAANARLVATETVAHRRLTLSALISRSNMRPIRLELTLHRRTGSIAQDLLGQAANANLATAKLVASMRGCARAFGAIQFGEDIS